MILRLLPSSASEQEDIEHEDIDHSPPSSGSGVIELKQGDIRRYENPEDACAALQEGNPLSCFCDNEDQLYVTVGTSPATLNLHKLTFDDANGIHFQYWYAAVKLANDAEHGKKACTRSEVANFAKRFVLLFPFGPKNAAGTPMKYAGIASDWTYRSKEGTFTLPSLDNVIYS